MVFMLQQIMELTGLLRVFRIHQSYVWKGPWAEIFLQVLEIVVYIAQQTMVPAGTFVGLLNKNILSLLSDDSQTIFVGTESGGVYRSVDNGITWSFLGLPNTTITSLSRFGTDIIAGTNSGIYKSPDNGTNWFYVGLNESKYSGYPHNFGQWYLSSDK